MAAVERNSDGSYDAVDSGGFGKDYHGQDAFGERIGGTGIGGSHFGGFEEGHVGLDKDNTGKYEKLSSEALAQTESMPKSAFEADNGNESEEEASSGMKDSLRDLNSESSEENSNTGSMYIGLRISGIDESIFEAAKEKRNSAKKDTSFQIGGIEENEAAKEKMNSAKEKMDRLERRLNQAEEDLKAKVGALDRQIEGINKDIDAVESGILKVEDAEIPTVNVDLNPDFLNKLSKATSSVKEFAGAVNFEINEETMEKMSNPATAVQAMRDVLKEVRDILAYGPTEVADKIKADYETAKADYETAKADYDKQLESSFTDKMKEDKVEAEDKPKANKDSTKELPKGTPSRNDFVNHAADTLKGVVDRISGSTTANALGLKSIEEFARENDYNPEKLSTMKAYQSYQNKEIMKAIPGIVKQIGSYITERVKDVVDPSQLPERIRNTLARYNLATLIGAAILSIESGAGIQASIDQALTMVDPEDQVAVSDYLEDVLNDEGTVNDLGNAFDDALAPEQSSDTAELDESIVNIGRKDNTDYSGFNAGLGTTSDADVKVFIARNVKSDPILRRMISKTGK